LQRATLHKHGGRSKGLCRHHTRGITPRTQEVSSVFGYQQSKGEPQRTAGALVEESPLAEQFSEEIADLKRGTSTKDTEGCWSIRRSSGWGGGSSQGHVDVRNRSSTARNLEEEIGRRAVPRRISFMRLVLGGRSRAAADCRSGAKEDIQN